MVMLEVLVFKSQYCPNCQRLEPVIKELAEELKDKVKFSQVDISSQRDMAVRYSILSVPATLVFKNGQKIKQINGFIPKDKLIEELEAL